MQDPNNRSSQLIFLFGDLCFLNLSFFAAAYLRFAEIRLQETVYFDYYVQLWVFVNLLWFLLSLVFKTYQSGTLLEPRRSVSKTFNVFAFHLFALLLLLVSLKKNEYSRLFISYFYLFSFLSITPWHFFFLRFLRELRARGKSRRRIVAVGDKARIDALEMALKAKPELGGYLVAKFPDGEGEPGEEVIQYLGQQPVDELFLAFSEDDHRFQRFFKAAEDRVVRVRVLPDLGVPPGRHLSIDFYGEVPVLSLRDEPLDFWHNRFLKRLLDVFISSLVFIFIFPWLWPLLALGVKWSSAGPILFRQKRSGYRGETFHLIKFRSMVLNNEADQKQAIFKDSRTTGFGRFLRQYHLDELPQFWLVFIGKMSVVGPRPHMLAHTELYRQKIDRYMLRHFAKPGITGLAQVKGFRGPHDEEHMQERVRIDAYYLENWSLLLDVSIILRTLTIKGE